MKVSGAADVHASPDAVWAALTDPGLLGRAVPGLDQIDFAGDGTCQFILTTAIAAVRGSYAGQASVVERNRPGAYVLRVSATGAKGTVNGDVTIRLAPTDGGTTELSYTADAAVGGAIAGIGQLMLASIARRIAAEAIRGLDAALAAPAPVEPPAAIADHAAEERGRGRTAIELARQGIRRRGERVPAAGSLDPVVRTGLVAGAATAVAAIVVGAIVRKRRGRS